MSDSNIFSNSIIVSGLHAKNSLQKLNQLNGIFSIIIRSRKGAGLIFG
jgi:hypothetical protein